MRKRKDRAKVSSKRQVFFAHSHTFNQIRNILSFIFILVAISVLFYPIVANYFASRQAASSVERYNQSLSQTSETKIKRIIDDAKLYNAKLYNDYIYTMSQRKIWPHPIPDYNKTLNIDKSGMMGYISIPQIGVGAVPIYHGDSERTLSIGVGHLEQSSLPIGGINTHTVLAAHSGRVNNTLFTNLDKLKYGDVFYITTLNLKLKYEIDDIKIVSPNDTKSLNIVKGKDLATLITCYPTGINNKRLLVTGKRIPLSEITATEKENRNLFGYDFWVFLGSGLLFLWGLLSLFFLIFSNRKKYYQVSLVELKEPTLSDGKTSGEFGSGFYLTSSKKLAQVWVENLLEELEVQEAFVNSYRFKKERKLKYLIYYKKTKNWEKFVQSNLEDRYEGKVHDFVKAPHYDPEIRVKKRDNQLVLQTEEAFKHLKFIKSKKVKESE